ncbi:MAG: hypothetical protein EHM58_11185 [Ignavibacteriae bacterium]|nr:MAG: hypothetical protein EHM58_11185 [Ignavibacteriota bacterium]
MKFIINKIYRIDTDENLVQKLSNGEVTGTEKIESRITEVLLILAGSNNKVISRELLIDKVWNNYPGGDDGLTQAISFLRKILNDNSKTLIETIPKKGYKLNAEVVFPQDDEKHIQSEDMSVQFNRLKRTNKLLWAAALIFLIFVIWLAFFQTPKTHFTPKPMFENNKDTVNVRTPEPDKNPVPPAAK